MCRFTSHHTQVHFQSRAVPGGAAAWVASHLEMRDFFIFSALREGKRTFSRDGTASSPGNHLPKEHWRPLRALPAPPAPAAARGPEDGGGGLQKERRLPLAGRGAGTTLPASLNTRPHPPARPPPAPLADCPHALWGLWMTGTTGYPLVDAAMAELTATGYTIWNTTVTGFGWVFFMISFGSPRMLMAHMRHVCGEPNEPELTIRVPTVLFARLPPTV